jgi:hypothetical protein
MEATRLPPAVLAAAHDRRGGASEVAATALDGLLEAAGDPDLLERAVAVLLAGQPAMAPIWHLAVAARGADPRAALAGLRGRLAADADAAVVAATAWLRRRGAGDRGAVATVSHSSLVDRVLDRLGPSNSTSELDTREVLAGVVGADAVGPAAFLNAVGTRELVERVPTLVVATPIKLVPGEVFGRLAGPGFEAVPLASVAAVAVGGAVLSPARAGRLASAAGQDRRPRRR